MILYQQHIIRCSVTELVYVFLQNELPRQYNGLVPTTAKTPSLKNVTYHLSHKFRTIDTCWKIKEMKKPNIYTSVLYVYN